jgi:hypothetical protein
MNLYAVGLELANNGVGEPFPVAQIDAMFTAIIAINRAYGCAVDDVYQHQPWAPGRKIDPATAAAVQGPWRPRSINSSGTWNLDDLTAEVRRRAGTIPPPEPPPGGNMSAAAVVVGDDRLVRYFVIGADAAVWQLWWDDVEHAWSPWQTLGGGIVGDLTATATPGSPRIDVAGRGGDGALWASTWDGMAWLPWAAVAPWP